jgi:Arc/MetJ-type ribon-helix-helix transcriptional regulator
VFDNPARAHPEERTAGSARRPGPEDERIALRCHLRELQLLDTFVASGEFRSRSDLMRHALLEFLRSRATDAVAPPAAALPEGLVEVPVRLRAEEVETFRAYAKLVGNDRPLGDLLAELVRHGEVALKVSDLAARHRGLSQDAAQARASMNSLKRSADDLERRGVVGR